jgi:hypothetical protein
MSLHIRSNLATNKLVQKISAFIIGFFCWSHLNILQHHTITCTIPLCFYNQEYLDEHKLSLEAPETITITLRGKKGDLARIDYSALATHINAAQLHKGKNGIFLTSKDLFLPDTISVIHYSPLPLIITESYVQTLI